LIAIAGAQMERARSNGGPGERVAVPEEGGAHRDLRAEAVQAGTGAQLTARLPPPSGLAVEPTVIGAKPLVWVGAERANGVREMVLRCLWTAGRAALRESHAGRGAVIADGQARDVGCPCQSCAAVLGNHSVRVLPDRLRFRKPTSNLSVGARARGAAL
jgi:hypothetical protein